MNLNSIMTRRVFTVGLDDTLDDVRALFQAHGFHHVVVIDRLRVVGVISDRDLLRTLSPFVGKRMERRADALTLRTKVHQFMTREPVIATHDTPVRYAARLMLECGISCLPIVEEGGLCIGIVTVHDVMRWCLNASCAATPATPAAFAA